MKFKWAEQNIQWFEAACQKTTFYQDIVRRCAHLLDSSSIVLDIGCGTGPLALALAPHVQTVVALDINGQVINHLNKKCRALKIANLKPQVQNWLRYDPLEKFDLVFVSYCNGLTKNWEKLLSLTERYLIIILPEYWGKGFEVDKFFPGKLKNNNYENLEQLLFFLQTNKLAFQITRSSCEFGQPLKNLEDYKSFLRFYYQIEEQEIPEIYTNTYLQKNKEGFYLPNLRESGMIIIDKEDLHV